MMPGVCPRILITHQLGNKEGSTSLLCDVIFAECYYRRFEGRVRNARLGGKNGACYFSDQYIANNWKPSCAQGFEAKIVNEPLETP
jgi:hypothetical protein